MILLLISRRQERKKLQSIHALKKAFIQLILESGDSGAITVSEIADRADFNRSTFYFHYKDKNDLLEDLFHDAIKGVKESLIIPFQNKKQISLSDVIPTTRLLFEHIEKNKNLFRALHAIPSSPSLYERLEQLYWSLFSEEMFLLKHDSIPDVDYELILSYQTNALLGLIKYWVQSDFKFSSNYMCDQMTMIILNRPADMVIMKRAGAM
ncbi:TetR/AcrR family transcriptional regulator [Paenibacillus sp. M1]|uniref:TetR/AcrR family transcriptional regulator n=1 Tax=Paenibacillus haidiansis TaxID=1574488 RepID=A0ABU7VTR2_9BACL